MHPKEKIISESVHLFNAEGFKNVSIRDISDSHGISSGNFAYHFKNKEALLVCFYENVLIATLMDVTIKDNEGLPRFKEILESMIAFGSKYRFFFLDLNTVFERCPKIKKHFIENFSVSRVGLINSCLKKLRSEDLLLASDDLLDESAREIWRCLVFCELEKQLFPQTSQKIHEQIIVRRIFLNLKPLMRTRGLDFVNQEFG